MEQNGELPLKSDSKHTNVLLQVKCFGYFQDYFDYFQFRTEFISFKLANWNNDHNAVDVGQQCLLEWKKP